jgi:hypothetical protein
MGDLDPEEGVGSKVWVRRYALQPISSTVHNPSASGPRMHDYAIRVGGAGAAAVQVAPWVVDCADSCDGDPCGYWKVFGDCFCFGISVCAALDVALGV